MAKIDKDMEENTKQYALMQTYLTEALNAGKKWAVHNGMELPDTHFELTLFESSFEASDYCARNLFGRDEDGELIDLCYVYNAVENILVDLNILLRNLPPNNMDTKALQVLLEHHQVKSLHLTDDKDMATYLSNGLYVPVQRENSIIPMDFINQFHLVEHRHDYHGLIYELGHKHRMLETFSKYEKAHETFIEMAHQLPAASKGGMTELLLIGQFNGQQLMLDAEGRPEFNTGLEIGNAGYFNDGLNTNIVCDPTKESTVSQRLLTRLDAISNTLVFFDHCLQDISLSNSIQSYIDNNFHFDLHASKSMVQSIQQQGKMSPHPDESTKVGKGPKLSRVVKPRQDKGKRKKRN